MASWDVFKPDVLVHVPTAPDPMIEMALRRASREFCGRTRAWRKWCACAETGAGTAIYTITIPTDAQAIRLERVTAGGKPVAVIPYHWHEADWETDPTQAGSGVSTDDLASFTSTTGSLTGSVRAMVDLMPTRDAATCDDFLVGMYLEAIVAGACRNLLSAQGAPWKDLQAASIQAGIFEDRCGQAGVASARGHTGRFSRPRPVWY